jgi:L-lysine 6-transaminase
MVRATHVLRIIEQEHLLKQAAQVGGIFLEALQALSQKHPVISAVRGRGLMMAFDLPTRAARETFYRGLFDHGLLALRSGERSIRFRPALDLPENDVAEAMDLLRKQCLAM